MMRQGLRALLSSAALAGEMEVVGEAGDGRSTIALVKELAPNLVIMDISMPGLNGVEATRQIIGDGDGGKDVKIIALSMHSDRRFVAQVLKAGASGYLLKDSAFGELAQAIRAVMSGQTYLSPGITGPVVADYLRKVTSAELEGPSAATELTSREREVLQLMAEGNSTKDIAATLGVSSKTIETHRRRIMGKLNMYSVAELTKYAIREGLTSFNG